MKLAYLEILDTAQGLYAIERAIRNFASTDKVRFDAKALLQFCCMLIVLLVCVVIIMIKVFKYTTINHSDQI